MDVADGSPVTLTIDGGGASAAKKAGMLAQATGQPLTKAGTQKSLSIVNGEPAGVSAFSLGKELTQPELKKSAIGAVAGGIIGFIIPIPGTFLAGAIIGGGVGVWM